MEYLEVEIADLKQEKINLELTINTSDSIKKDIYEEEMRYKEDLINNLSLELARTKNNKKFFAEKAHKLQKENTTLKGDVKKLISSKGSLEKSIIRLTKDKNIYQKRLDVTEQLIQSKISEIWDIKESLDDAFKITKSSAFPTDDTKVDLPPIVVSSRSYKNNVVKKAYQPGYNGRIVSINEENNFIIVDIGKDSGLREGDNLSVFRDKEYIARLEVIQVRNDIAAADLKEQWSKVNIGDMVR